MSTTHRDPRLPDVIKIDDIASGKIEPNLIYNELDRLKVEINILRNDMSLFIKALATIPENQNEQEYYKVAVLRLKTVQSSIKEYCVQYYKLLPIINLAQIRLGHEVEIIPQNKTPTLPNASAKFNTKSSSNKTNNSRKSNDLTKNGSISSVKSNSTENAKNGNTPGQAIVL